MSTVVDARLPASDFALGETLEARTGARFEVCRAAANTAGGTMPFLWGVAPDQAALRESLECDDSTRSVEVVGRFEDEHLYGVEWSVTAAVVFDLFLDEGVTLLNGAAADGEWHLRLVYPERRQLESVYGDCEGLGVELEVERAYSLSDAYARDQFQLTEKQYETIVAAHEMGYYEIPRAIDQRELADRLDVSHQALSERLRRGHEALIANGLGADLAADAGRRHQTDRVTLSGPTDEADSIHGD